MLEINKRACNIWICLTLTIAAYLFTTSVSLAYGLQCKTFCFKDTSPWHAVLSLSPGIAISSDIGKSRTFPIINPITDEFYIYSANRPTQTASVFDGFIGLEWACHPQWSLQMGLGYNQAWNFRAEGSFLQGTDVQSEDRYSYHYNVLTRQLLAEGKLLYNFKKCYHPYFSLGLGAAFNNASDSGTNVPPFSTFTRQYKNNTKTSFTYSVGVGIDADVLDHLRLGIGYRFADFGQMKLGDATIDTTSVGGTLSQNHIYASEILMQFTIIS